MLAKGEEREGKKRKAKAWKRCRGRRWRL